jgi:hypothetical protein
MFAAAVMAALCVAGVAFCVRFLLALRKESGRGQVTDWAVLRLAPGEGVIAELQPGKKQKPALHENRLVSSVKG